MPSIQYGTGSYRRTNGDLPELKLINMFLEEAKTSESGVALLSRPGLAQSATRGNGPINGIFSKPGTFSGDKFAVSGSTLYREGSSLGTINGSGPIKWAASATEVVVTRGQTAYSYNGTNLQAISFPDGANVRSVAYIGGLFLFVRDLSHRIYFSATNDARSVDPLDFFSAEREPDSVLDIMVVGDNIWPLGQNSTEVWAHTGEADLPFTRFEQIAPEKGIYGTGCAVNADNALYMIGHTGSVYRTGGEGLQRVSDHSLEERIIAASSASMFTFQFEGHEFIAVRLNSGTWLLDAATGEWCEFQTGGLNWIVSCATMVGRTAYFGHESTNQVLAFSSWADLSSALERRFTAAIPLDTPLSVDRISLWVNVGQSEVLSGQGSDPQIEMRSSSDAGQTWSDWESVDLGPTGDYRCIPEWRALGTFDFPGAMFEFRVSDPVPLRLSSVKANDPAGGRGR